MRNQEVVLRKLERLEAELRKVSYFINRDQKREAVGQVQVALELLADTTTLASKTQVNDFS